MCDPKVLRLIAVLVPVYALAVWAGIHVAA
jgi:hypothetical protein